MNGQLGSRGSFCLCLLCAGAFGFTALADDFTNITDAAYCSGVISRNLELSKRAGPLAVPDQGEEQHLERVFAIVEGALKQHRIDIETVRKLTLVGHRDAQLCWDITSKCFLESAKRAEEKDADLERSQRIQANCERQVEPVCKRVTACN